MLVWSAWIWYPCDQHLFSLLVTGRTLAVALFGARATLVEALPPLVRDTDLRMQMVSFAVTNAAYLSAKCVDN
jgi:ABC-type proline/glycine betaine transport system permease subunit